MGNLNPFSFFDRTEKIKVVLISLGWFGFLPLLAPITLLPALVDLSSYFVIGNNLKEAQDIFMHYRVTLAPLLTLSVIFVLEKYSRLKNNLIALFLLTCLAFFQYFLHLPLSYLTKRWFWTTTSAVSNINQIIAFLPKQASVVSQNNITPHLTQRLEIFTLWPTKRDFDSSPPCGVKTCNWLYWSEKPEYLIVDISPNWDIRHFLANREDYLDGLNNLEKAGVIVKNRQINTAILYKIIKSPK